MDRTVELTCLCLADCAPGSITVTTGSSACLVCSPGTFSNVSRSTSWYAFPSLPTLASRFALIFLVGLHACSTICPVGKYQQNFGATTWSADPLAVFHLNAAQVEPCCRVSQSDLQRGRVRRVAGRLALRRVRHRNLLSGMTPSVIARNVLPRGLIRSWWCCWCSQSKGAAGCTPCARTTFNSVPGASRCQDCPVRVPSCFMLLSGLV